MVKQVNDNREPASQPPSLLIAAHCSTIRRKAARIDAKELSAIFNDCVHEAYSNKFPLQTYLNSLNEIVTTLNSNFPPVLIEISSHSFFTLVCNTIRLLLRELYTTNELNNQEIYILRNCTVLIHNVVKQINDVSKILQWITEETFLGALANCLIHINKISKATENQHIIKQITRLFNVLCNIQQRLPINLHQHLFVRLLQATIACLTSSNYVKLFSNLQANAISFTEIQKLFLIKCPYFLTAYNGPSIEKAVENLLEIMLPRYVSILDKHMKTIKEWQSPMMRAIHNLIITLVYAEGYLSSHIYNKSFQLLINHLLHLLNESSLINKIHPNANNLETLLIDATLVVFSVLVYEPNGLNYIKQLKPIAIFRQLTTTSHETIVLNAYMMLVYVMDENDIETAVDNLSHLLSTTLYLLGKAIETRYHTNVHENSKRETTDRNIMHLLETLKGLAQYEQIKNDVIKYRIVSHLMYYYEKVHGLSKQLLLECFWTLSFNERIAQQLREYSLFILSLHHILQTSDDSQQNTIRHSNSYCSRQNGTVIALIEGTNNGLRKVADGLLWKLINEPEFRENIIEKMNMRTEKKIATDNQNYKYDIMISYCYADKDIVHNIHKFLTNQGYNVWFDRTYDHKYGMEVVAEAIENSQFVIICMSDSYKSDNYCQAEAEYAFNSKRFLLPLILRTGYRPDGWLASITKKGSTYIDFAGSDFKTASTWLLEEIKQRHCKKEIPVFRLTPSKQINMVNNSFVSSAIFDKPYAHAESLTVTGPIPTIESADVIKTQQAQIHSVSRTPPSDATPFTTSTIDIQQRPIHVHPISTSTTFASMVSTTCDVNSHQQQHTSTLSYPKSPTPVAHTFAMSSVVNKQCEQHQRSGHPVSKPLTSHSIVSATSVVADKQQQKHRRMTESPVSQSTITKSFSSDLPVTVEKHQQHGFTYPVSTPLTTTSAISIAIDRQQEPTQKPSFSRSSIPGYRYSTASAVVDKQQLPEAWYSASPTSIRSSSSSTVITNLDHKQQQKTTNPVLIPLTPSTVSCDTYLNVEKKQQKTPPHPKPRTSTINAVSSVACSNVIQQQQQAIAESKNDTTLPVKPITINIQQHQPIETPSVSQSATPSVSRSATPSVSRSATPGFKASDECISAIKQSQQQTLGCYISCPPARTNAVLSTTYTGVPQPQPQQLTPTHSVPQPLTNNIVSSASTTNIDKLQEKIQLRPISQSQTYNSVYSGTSVLVDQQPQLTPMQVLSPLLTNSIVSSPSHVAVNNEQQLPPRIPYVAQSRLPTSTSSGEHITAHKKPRKTVTGYFVSSSPTVTHTTLPTTSTLVTESPELTSMHLVSQPLTNKTVFSGSTTSTNNLQQKTQGHPVSHLQKSGSMSFATSAPLGQQPQLVQMHPDSQQLRNNIVSSDLPIIIDKLQQTTQVRPASQSQTSGSAPSAAYLYLDQHSQLTPMHSVPQSLRNSTASSASTTNTDKLQQKAPPRPVIQSQTTRGLPPATSVLFDQQQQLTQMHLVSHQLTNNRVSPAAPIITNKQQQKPQVPTVPQLQTPASVSSTTSFHLGQQPKLKPMPFVSQPLSNNTVSSSSSSSSSSSAINIDKQQQKTQVYPVSQSQAYDSMHSGTSTLLNPQSHLTSMHFVSQQLRNNIVSSDSPIVIDQKQQETQVDPVSQSQAYGSVYSDISGGFDQEPQLTSMYLVSQPLTNGTVSSTSIGTIGKQQQKTPCRPVSQLQTSASLSSVHHDQQPQLTPMHAISQPSTNNAVSSAPMTTIGKQPQKTQVRPVSQLQTSASVSSATYVRLNQQPKQTPMHFVPQQLRNNTASSNSSITIDELQQKTKVYPVSQSQTHASVYSGTSALLDQEPQLTPLFFVAESSTNGSVSCGVPVTNDKRQKRPTQVPLVSQSTVADSTSSDKSMSAKKQPRREILVCSISQPRTATDAVPHTTSTVDNQPQQKTSKHVVAQSSANNTISSASTMSTKKQQQESSVPGTSRSQAPTSGVSVTPVSMKKQEGMQRHLNSRSYPHPFHELPRLPEEYTNRKTNNSRYRTVPINLWDDTDVLDFLFDSRLHAMMPLCESISGKALIRLFRMCQEKPRRLYNQLNDELRDRFNGLNLPLGVYAEFLIEMDYLVGLTPATIPEIPISRVKDEERATFRPRTVQEEPISMQRSLRPLLDITVSRSLSHSGLPAETLPGTTASNNRSFLERSFLQSPSAPGRPYMLILESIEESTLVLQ